ncbi:MAG TPA: glycosyl hydrolase, partial [Cytophagales bacterium]
LAEKITVQDPKQREVGAVLQALTAYGDNGQMLDLLGQVAPDGTLGWKPTSGNWELYAAFSGKTRQMVKRAAPGGEGYTLDHLSRPAVDTYIGRFDEAFAGKPAGIRAFYNDSYEVYEADWSPDFFTAFQQRRGYDLRPFLRELAGDGKTEKGARLKADYRETMGEMLLENFTRPWTEWAHGKGALTKNQAHGSPGNLLDLYATVDIPECETFGSSYFPIPGLRRDSADVRNVDPDPVMLKFASSAGHAAGRPLVSSETFTWLTEHFKTSLSQCKPEVEQLFLAGVNHVFYHGVTYSPADVPWPGWLFYASVNFTPANSQWPHLKGLNAYVTRCQSVLQAGTADNELLVYWPIYDVWSKPEGREMLIKVHDIDQWLHPTPFYGQVTGLMKAGYSLDFASDRMLAGAQSADGLITTAPSAPPHRVLIIPQTRFMPPATLRHVLRLAGEGATVVMEKRPEDVPGLGELERRRQELQALLAGLAFAEKAPGVRSAPVGKGQILLAEDVQKALAHRGVRRETLTDTGLKFIRRATPEGKYYYLVNHTPNTIDTPLPLNAEARSVVILDPQSGSAGLAASTAAGPTTTVRVQVPAGEALILKATREKTTGLPPWQYAEPAGPPLPVKGAWDLQFTEGGPERPAGQKLTELVSWTQLPDPKAEAFSGTGRYTVTFALPDEKADEYLLHLGDVRESARVWINGHDAGMLWSIPFQARIGKYLKAG